MRSLMGGSNNLQRAIDNIILTNMEEDMVFPSLAPISDMLWKFQGHEDPKPFGNCSKEELLEVVSSLVDHIKSQDDRLKIQEFSKQALIGLL